MTALDRVVAGLDTVDAMLGESALEPNPERRDWPEAAPRVRELAATIQSELIGPLEAACEALTEPAQAPGLRTTVAHRLASAAAVLHASGDSSGCSSLLSQAVALGAAGEARDLWSAGRGDPASFVTLQRALWLRARGRRRASEKLLRTLGQSPSPVFAQAAGKVRALGWPVSSAPALFRLNGCGVGLYGRADERPDGTHVATYFLTLLWVPVLPLAAYRVRKEEGSGWSFFTRERLAGWAKAWQGVAAVAVLGAAAWFGGKAYLESPSRLARVATAEAARLESSGREAEALRAYHEVVGRYGSQTDVGAAAMGVLRLSARSVHEPCTPDQVAAAGRVVAGFEKLPEALRGGAHAAFLVERLERWAGQIGEADPKSVRAAIVLLDSAERVVDGSRKAALHEKRAGLEVALADGLAPARPLDALGHYVRAGGATAVASAGRLLGGLGDDDALWSEAAHDAEEWLKAAGPSAPGAAEVKARLGASLASVAARQERVAKAGPEALLAELRAHPGDQLVAVAVARHQRTAGDAAGCVRSLDSPRGVGWLTGEAQIQRAACLMDLDRDDEAAGILSAYLDDRLPAFHVARRTYEEAHETAANRLVEDARAGRLPEAVSNQLNAASEEKQGEIFRGWLSAELDKDARLQALGAEYGRYRDVVPASLALGTVELKRSQRTAGESRHRHLAAAERAFLAIREEAEGAPSYHLELAQVYHRLGKAKEGDAELAGLLARNDPDLTMDVAEVYRQLGVEDRARAILEELYSGSADVAMKRRVAFQRANAQRDIDDQDAWLEKADPNDPSVRIQKLENLAQRSLLAGRDEEADRAFSEAAASYDRDAKRSGAAMNNAALAYLGRYAATGDPLHRRAALARLESSLRLAPDSAIVHGNLAEALGDSAVDAALAGFVDLRVLRPSSGDGATLFSALSRGPLRDRLRKALAAQADFLRARTVSEREAVLSPNKPSVGLRQLRWLDWAGDAAGLRALEERLRQTPPDVGMLVADREDWRSGRRDGIWRPRLAQGRSLAETRVKRARVSGKRETLAAALVLLADAEDSLAKLEPGPAGIDRAVAACREAAAAWPEAGLEETLADALLLSAAEHAAESSPEWRARWTAERRRSSVSWALLEASRDPGGGPALAAVKARPELAEALALRRVAAARQPEVGHLLLARAVGDAALESLAHGVAARPEVEPELRLAAVFDPEGAEAKGRLALFDSLGGASGTVGAARAESGGVGASARRGSTGDRASRGASR